MKQRFENETVNTQMIEGRNAVHEALAAISDGELLGSDTHVEIVTVDLFSSAEQKPAKNFSS